MNIQGKVIAIIVTLYWLFPSASFTEARQQSAMEHIEVNGKPPKQFYRQRLYQAEEAFFASFNQLVQQDAFKVTCKKRKQHAFTRLTERICEANFVSDIKHQGSFNTSELQTVGQSSFTQRNNSQSQKKYIAMQQQQAELMTKLINTHPRLREKYKAFRTAKQQLDNYQEE